jgi:nucleotide-binding universal stress UspA family protein
MSGPQKITVGIDDSPAGICALRWAAREASTRNQPLCVVHVYSYPMYGNELAGAVVYPLGDGNSLRADHLALAERHVLPIREAYPELAIEIIVELGNPVGTLLDQSKTAELVVVGSRGAGAIRAMLLGSVAHSVSHHSTCPVVIVPDAQMQPSIERIVVGTDGSPAAERAVSWAANEAAIWKAELTVVHVWEYPYLGARSGSAEPADLMELDAANVLREAIAQVRAQPAQPRKLHGKLLEGGAAAELVAASAGGDLLVMGARGRGGIRSALLGSSSSSVIHHAYCPVAIIKS